MYDVDTDLVLDSITLLPIPDERLVTVGEGEQSHCYDIKTILSIGKNPFTRQPWPSYVLERIRRYLFEEVVLWEVRTLTYGNPDTSG